MAAHLTKMGAEERQARTVIMEDENSDDEDDEDDEINRDGTLPASEPARPL